MNPLAALSVFDPMVLVALPLVVFVVFVGLFIPSMLCTPSPKPELIARGIACYILKGFGLTLLGVALLPMLYSLFTAPFVPPQVLLSVALLFVVGVGTFVQANRILQTIDDASVAVSRAIFHHVCEVVGSIVAILSMLSLMLSLIVRESIGGWELPISLLLLSLLLTCSFSLHTAPRKKASKAPVNGKKK